ncbi:MAG: hypothetical protein M0P55_09175 [Clostridiales bacterium]|nr:hypothetical protein [Clostridiales bacterium]
MTTTRQTEGTTTETSPDETGPSPDTYTYIPDVIEPVWTFSTQETFPAWVNPMPFVNPMGREDLYTDILFEAKGDYTFEYANMQNTRVFQDVYGDAWTLHVPFDDSKTPDENKQFILDIEHYISAKNGFVMGYYDQSVVFVLNDADMTRWWGQAAVDDDQIVLSIVRQDELKVGQTMVIRTADYPDQIVRFASYNPGDAYQSIHLAYDQGEVSFEISTENRYGSYVRRYTTRDTLYDELTTDFYYDSVMYDPGFSNWELTWRDSAQTAEIAVTLLRTGDIPQVTYGEPLGAIKVSSEHVATIGAFPAGRDNLRIDHPEFSYEDSHLDQTPDGDYIMFVPAGLWDVKLYPRGDALVENYETLLVPVNSGEMTTVEVPFGISNA